MPLLRAWPPLLALIVLPAVNAVGPPAATPAPSPSMSVVPLRSYAQALRRSAASGKNVLLLFSNPHCGPCHAIEELLFRDPAGTALVSSAYVPVVLVISLGGTDKTLETREARMVATRFGVLHPPALLIVSRSGSRVGRLVGITRSELFSGLRQYAVPVQ